MFESVEMLKDARRRATNGSVFIALLVSSALSQASVAPPEHASVPFPEGDAAVSSELPHVPEPLLFDLVRPLGAAKGELEINALVQHASGGTAWAPEIEYAFADGYALELELPFEGATLEEYKVAVQGTAGTLLKGRMIHGWQAIAYYERDSRDYTADLIYLNGARLSSKWSVFNMVGMRRAHWRGDSDYLGLVNNSIFYDYSKRLTFGLEVNSEIGDGWRWRHGLVPQIHFDVDEHVTVQLGGGRSRLNVGQPTEKTFIWRLIYSW
nr:hypothetical protein [uncultured Steroidobacter sp.]